MIWCQSLGHKGPVLKPRDIATGRARTQFLFYSILFYSILFYSILFYSILFYSILFYSILVYSILLTVSSHMICIGRSNQEG